MATSDPCKVITGVARSTFMFCTKLEQRGKKITEDTPKTVKTAVLIPKRDKRTVAKIKKAMEAACMKKFNHTKYARVGKDGCPLRDVDLERDEGDLPDSMADCPDDHYYFNCTGYKLPGLLDEDGEPVDTSDLERREEILVSGFYFKFSVTFKGYSNESDGVNVKLNNVMFIREGERLDGGVSAENEDWGDDDDDFTDDEPRSRRSRSYDDDEDDEPRRSRKSRRSRDYDDEDEDDEPPRRRSRRSRRNR